MKSCRRCKFFRLHLDRNKDVGLCSQWVQTEFANGFCDWFKSREFPKRKYDPWSINGKSWFEWIALTRGVDCMTGHPLEYWKIKEVAEKFGIPLKDIEKYKNNKVKQLELI